MLTSNIGPTPLGGNGIYRIKVKRLLISFRFYRSSLTGNIGHRASIYVEEYTLSSHLRAADAIIVATAVKNNLMLASSNEKHYKAIKELKLNAFKP